MKTLSSFKGMRIFTEEGMFLGHLADLRADPRVKQGETAATRIGTLVYGTAGWLTHIGLRAAKQDTVDWRDVVRIEGDRVIIRNRNPQKRRRHGAAHPRPKQRHKASR